MKNTRIILITALTAIGLMAIGCMSSSNSMPVQEQSDKITTEDFSSWGPTVFLNQTGQEFYYDVGPRYMATFTKTEIGLVRSIAEFENLNFGTPAKMTNIVSCQSVMVSTLNDDYEPIQRIESKSVEFNAAQLNLFQNVDYSTDVLISSEYMLKIPGTDRIIPEGATPHITIVPEKQAEYEGGKKAFVEYLKSNSLDQTAIVKEDKLKSGKVRFTVSKNGTISKAILISTSGYPSIDKHMTKLISESPEKWEPATDGKGNHVEQELVFSFGTIGC